MSRSVVKSMCAVLKIEEERRCPWWRDENEGKIKLQKKVCPSLKPNSPRELFDFLSVVALARVCDFRTVGGQTHEFRVRRVELSICQSILSICRCQCRPPPPARDHVRCCALLVWMDRSCYYEALHCSVPSFRYHLSICPHSN